MLNPSFLIVSLALLSSRALSAEPRVYAQVDYAWDMMCSGKVRPIPKKLKSTRGAEPLALTETIQPCTKHVYEFSRKTARRVSARLRGSEDTWMMLSQKGQNGHSDPTETLEEELTVEGKYLLTIVTIKPRTYVLELKFQ